MKWHLSKLINPRLELVCLAVIAWLCSPCLAIAQHPTASPTPEVIPPGFEKFLVATKSKENLQVPFYVRVPMSFRNHPTRNKHRVLFICPSINWNGLTTVMQSSLQSLADERKWFIIAPTFLQSGLQVRERKLSYYYPETFSGKAVLDALDQIAKKYPISTRSLLLHGLSGGAQFVHRFAIWAPERVAAVAVNSSSWFDDPNEKSQTVAWLVTIGESDPNYANTLTFVDKLRKVGALPILRSYIGMAHERGQDESQLNIEFLKFYDDLTRSELETKPSLIPPKPQPPYPVAKMEFVADSQRWRYFPKSPEAEEDIAEDEKIYIPTERIAKAWGTREKGEE